MSELVMNSKGVLAAFTGMNRITSARDEADKLAEEYNLKVADFPMLIDLMRKDERVKDKVRAGHLDTLTWEYYGMRDGQMYFEVWNSVGSRATAKGLKEAMPQILPSNPSIVILPDYGFAPIADKEWEDAGIGLYNGKPVERIHLDELKKGAEPFPGMPHIIFADLDRDNLNVHPRGKLCLTDFLNDDLALMLTGSLKNRDYYAVNFLSMSPDHSITVGNYHRKNEIIINGHAKGRQGQLASNLYEHNIGGLYGAGRFGAIRC